jgi:hypothetical protein
MAKSNIKVAAVWAVGSCALALAAAWPDRLDAVDRGVFQIGIEKPMLKVGGVEFTCKPSDWNAVGGRPLDFSIDAVNQTDKAVTTDLSVQMMVTTIPSPLSRVPATPQMVWEDQQSVVLEGGKSGSYEFATPSIRTDRRVQLIISSRKDSMMVSVTAAPLTTRPGDRP